MFYGINKWANKGIIGRVMIVGIKKMINNLVIVSGILEGRMRGGSWDK